MAELKDLLTREKLLKNQLDKCIENGKKTALAKRTLGFFESKSAALKEIWTEYRAIDLQIQKFIAENPTREPHEYLKEDHFSIAETKYSDYHSELLEGLRKLKAEIPTQNSSTAITVPTTVVQHESSLPRIALPTFNGDYDTWRSFHDLYISLVHNNSRLSSVQKLHYLKSCLIGDAERVLSHTPITDKEYEPAWLKLKERFENTRILVNHQLKLLVNQPKLTIETSKGIKSLIDVTEECLQQLKSLEVNTDSWDSLLIYILVQKLPFITLKAWEEEQGSKKELPNFSQFKTFLNTRLKVLESITDALGIKPGHLKHQSKEKTSTYHIMKKGRCPACEGRHYINKCSKYKGMNVPARRKLMQSTGQCLNCLSQTHSTPECTSKYRCFKCNQAHHTSLHEDDANGQTSLHLKTSKSKKHDSKSSQPESKQLNQSHSADSSNIVQAFITRQNLHALLSTALVIARGANGKSSILRCLIDSDSQSSFLTEDACERLDVICTPTSITVTGIGISPAANSCKETTLQLQSCDLAGPAVDETFLILKRITDLLPRQKIPTRNVQHLVG